MTRSNPKNTTTRWVLVNKTGKCRASVNAISEAAARAVFIRERGGKAIPEGWRVEQREARGEAQPAAEAPKKAAPEPKKAAAPGHDDAADAQVREIAHQIHDSLVSEAALSADFHSRVNDLLVGVLVETAQKVREKAAQQRASYRDLGYDENQMPSSVGIQQAAFGRLMDIAQSLTPNKRIPKF